MKKQIQEVHDYFVGKICTGDYELISKTEHYATMRIDDYIFQIWYCSGSFFLETWTNSFMQLYFTGVQRETAFNLLSEKIRAQFAESDRIEKLAQLENLKKELGL